MDEQPHPMHQEFDIAMPVGEFFRQMMTTLGREKANCVNFDVLVPSPKGMKTVSLEITVMAIKPAAHDTTKGGATP